MKIGIDARFYGLHGGLGRYVSELVRELINLQSEHDFYLFLPPDSGLETVNPKIHLISTNIPWYGWREQIFLPQLLNRYHLDLVHFPHFNLPLLYRRPFVVTIHDLILLTIPVSARATNLGPFFYWLKRQAYHLTLRRAVKRSQYILATSQHTKKDILKFFAVPAEKITVTYQASRWPVQDSSQSRKKQLLYVGNCYPHKNVDFLMEAFSTFNQNHPEYSLIIAGHQDSFFAAMKKLKNERFEAVPITFIPDATDDQLSELYQTSEIYIFPSKYEGFGIPGLEAMSFGLPVLAANSSSLPEVYGSAASYFETNNHDDFLTKLSQLCASETERERLRVLGVERVQQFSWHQLAVDTLALYEKTMS